jgi:hypothetical protein
MALAPDHQVVVDGDAEGLGGRLDLASHLDVVARRLGIATGVIVHQDQRRLSEGNVAEAIRLSTQP